MKHIAFDLGAESGRAIVGEIVAGKLNMNELHRFTTQGMLVNGSLRWDIYRLFAEIKNGLKKYALAYGDEPSTMGVDTWGVDFGFLDKNKKLVSVPYHYRDKRTEGTKEMIDQRFGLERLYDLTGIQQMPINSLNQLIAAKNANDSMLKAGDKMMYIGDILHYFLCGEITTEYSVATTSNFFSTISDDWQQDVMETFGIDLRWMPKLVRPGDILGNICADVALETGVSTQCKIVAPAVHDTASAATAVPGEGTDIAYISSGTWSLAGLELDKANAGVKAKENNIANYGSSFGKKLFLKNVMGLWLIQQSRKQWVKQTPKLSYGDIVELAESAKPFYGFIDVDDEVFLNPVNMPLAVCEYLQRTNQAALDANNVGQVARVIFESLALKYRYIFDLLSKTTGKEIKSLNIIGGGIQNQMLTQFTADAMGVAVLAGPIEATAIGNILIQAYGTGELNDIGDLRKIVKETFEPKTYQPTGTLLWEEKYKKFLSICSIEQRIV